MFREDNGKKKRMSDEKCAICTESISKDWGKLECLHTFDFKCIEEWLKCKSECPLCRHNTNKVLNSKSEVITVNKEFNGIQIYEGPVLQDLVERTERRISSTIDFFNVFDDDTMLNNSIPRAPSDRNDDQPSRIPVSITTVCSKCIKLPFNELVRCEHCIPDPSFIQDRPQTPQELNELSHPTNDDDDHIPTFRHPRNNQNCSAFIRRGGITHFREFSFEQHSGYQSLNERTGRRVLPDPTQYTQSLNGMTRRMISVVNDDLDLLHEHQEVIGFCSLHKDKNDPNVIRITTKLHPVFCNGEIFYMNVEQNVDNIENNRTIKRKRKKEHINRKRDFRKRREKKSKKFRRINNTRRKYFKKHNNNKRFQY